jgi:hypothetical protein
MVRLLERPGIDCEDREGSKTESDNSIHRWSVLSEFSRFHFIHHPGNLDFSAGKMRYLRARSARMPRPNCELSPLFFSSRKLTRLTLGLSAIIQCFLDYSNNLT